MARLSKEEENYLKKLSYGIIKTELQKNNLDTNVFPIKYIEYCKTIFKVKGKSSKKLKICLQKRNTLGFHSKMLGNCIVIFIDKIAKIKNPDKRLINLIFTSYHETRHAIQGKFDEYSYDGFLNSVDRIYKAHINIDDYDKNHDDYSFEIGANIYAINKTKEFLKERGKDIYERNKDFIDTIEREYMKDYLTYNPINRTHSVLTFIKENNKKDLLPILNHFINEDGTFKTVTEIMKDKDYEKIDKKIIYSILSSESYLDEMLKEEIPESEKQLLIEALNYQKEILNNTHDNLEKRINQEKVKI